MHSAGTGPLPSAPTPLSGLSPKALMDHFTSITVAGGGAIGDGAAGFLPDQRAGRDRVEVVSGSRKDPWPGPSETNPSRSFPPPPSSRTSTELPRGLVSEPPRMLRGQSESVAPPH